LINANNKTGVMAIFSHGIHLPFNIFSTDRGQRLRVTYATKTNYDFKKHSIECFDVEYLLYGTINYSGIKSDSNSNKSALLVYIKS